MALHQKVEKILDNLRLFMPLRAQFNDPLGGPPIVVDHDNLHRLLVIDLDQVMLEGQIVANYYAEMARMQRAAEYEADIAEIRYVKWKSAKELEYRSRVRESAEDAEPEAQPEPEGDGAKKKKAAKPKAPARPTVAEAEAAYRDHSEYERMSVEPKRLRAIAGLLDDLKWSFKMKSEHLREASRNLGGYLRTDGAAEPVAPREPASALEDMQREAEEAVRKSGSVEALAAILSTNPNGPTRTASAPE